VRVGGRVEGARVGDDEGQPGVVDGQQHGRLFVVQVAVEVTVEALDDTAFVKHA